MTIKTILVFIFEASFILWWAHWAVFFNGFALSKRKNLLESVLCWKNKLLSSRCDFSKLSLPTYMFNYSSVRRNKEMYTIVTVDVAVPTTTIQNIFDLQLDYWLRVLGVREVHNHVSTVSANRFFHLPEAKCFLKTKVSVECFLVTNN